MNWKVWYAEMSPGDGSDGGMAVEWRWGYNELRISSLLGSEISHATKGELKRAIFLRVKVWVSVSVRGREG